MSTPAMAARPEPMANVSEMVEFTLMPMSVAAPRSSEQARMALPIRVLPVNIVRPIMTMMPVTTVTMVMALTTSCPSNRETDGRFTTDGNDLVSEPQMSSAEFCRK